MATDIVSIPAGLKQLTKLIRKRLEERRREKKLSKLETAEQLKLSELARPSVNLFVPDKVS